ncbi:MAG TPA: hypothetical protein P5205_04010 [Candidatus Paceibacterota bacterium]|nr:hypothetical protein [Verrucomicrobiota bacterium]HSA09514.1 hypothetical protein [Candidatus Paceibacterota bacterium]
MKRWAALTVLLYLVVLVVLAAPLLVLAMGDWWQARPGGMSLSEALGIYEEWGFWVWLAVMVLGQALLLITPIGSAERRPRPRRPLFVPVLTTAFLLALLLLGGILAVLLAVFGDDAFELFPHIGTLAQADAAHNPVTSQIWKATVAATGSGTAEGLFGTTLALAVCWLVWAVVFYCFARSDDPAALVKRITRWLLRGSILGLLVAVPSHIIVRHRNDCCAPAGTLLGIATGVSIMLLCFGPGVFFLFVERFGRLKPKGPADRAEGVSAESPGP